MHTLTPAQKGALTKKAKYGADYMARIGKKGGDTTFHNHGPEHFQTIGRIGLDVRVETRWDGDFTAFCNWFTALGQHHTDPAPWNGAFPHPGDEPAPAHLIVTPEMWRKHFYTPLQGDATHVT